MQNMNQPIQTWILTDNAMRLGHFNQSINPSQENRSSKGPPPGFQMAPCGCYFDPRIYRMEWIPNEFPQSSVCKLIQVPGIQSMPKTNWTDSQRYPKNPVQPPAYPQYQHTQENKPYILSHNKKDDLNNVTVPGNVTGLFPETQQAEKTKVMKQVKEKQKEAKLPEPVITNPGIKKNGDAVPTSANSIHTGSFERPQGNQRNDNQHQQQQTNIKGNGQLDNLILDSEGRNILYGRENSPVNIPDNVFWNPSPKDPQMTQQDRLLESKDVKKSHFCHLPTEVLLEEAIKMFDDLPANIYGAEFEDNSSSDPVQYTDSIEEFEIDDLRMYVSVNHSTCKDFYRDISALNLPEELLSADYNVPEISGIINSMDYLNNIGEITSIPNHIKATTQSFKLPKITSSPISFYMDIQECLEKMDEC